MLKLKTFKIVEKFKYFAIVSLLIIIAGLVMLCIPSLGMNVGIDFSGGTKVEIDFGNFAKDSQAQEKLNAEIKNFFTEKGCEISGELQTSPSDSGVTYEYRLAYRLNGKKLTTDEEEAEFIAYIQGDLTDENSTGICGELQDHLEEFVKANFENEVIEEDIVKPYTVGATASNSLLNKAILALSIAIVLMLIYIVIRFNLSNALAAIVALTHDVLIMIALTVIFRIPVNSTFIAAVITIVGYSINATIVIFDRIRESLKNPSSKDKTDVEIANEAISKTLTRSVLTSLTTLVTVALLAIFGVSSIREFVVPIIFGLIAGTYSSVFLASSFWVFFRKFGKKNKAKRPAKANSQKA